MGLEITYNKAEHHHENVQFRRVANALKSLFDKQNWDGILIGNPVNEDYYRFRADGLLFYNNGLVILDFKDYSGDIILPASDEDFEKERWFLNTKEGDQIKIDGGANFPNPFRQLKSYRQVMYDIINDDTLMKYVLEPSRVCALNIFSGPITTSRRTSRKVPYYQLVQELDLHTFLYVYTSKNAYEKAIADKFRLLFPAEEWQEDLVVSVEPNVLKEEPSFVDGDLEPVLDDFFKTEDAGVLILESKDAKLRDNWMKRVNAYALDNLGAETHLWSHSTRIASKIFKRAGLLPLSLYTTIYGGKQQASANNNLEEEDNEAKDEDEISQDVIGLRSDINIDLNDVFIIPEAHLVSRSLHQSDLIRFGSGRLLNDLFSFLKLTSTKRKLILIGDPYMLSYGRVEDTALNVSVINELFENGNIITYRNIDDETSSKSQIYKTRKKITSAIDEQIFNRLQYHYDESLLEVNQNGASELLTDWFGTPLDNEPINAVLFYSKSDARKTNLWIKDRLLRNGRNICDRDLLIVNNNINIPDESGFGHPTKVTNGSYLRVLGVEGLEQKEISLGKNKTSIILNYRKIRVKLLSNSQQPILSILILENYLNNEEDLDRQEQIALKIFTNHRFAELKKTYSFEKSVSYNSLQINSEFKKVTEQLKELEYREQKGERILKKDIKRLTVERNKIERRYKKDYTASLIIDLRKSDPYINAAYINYGWAITVHKSVGSQFDNVLFKVLQSDDAGITNESYFRWLYSGLTAIKNKSYIIHPQTISPFKECSFIDDVEITEHREVIKEKDLLEFSIDEINFTTKIIFPEDFNSNAAVAITLINDNLQDFKVESVRKFTEYLSKVVLIDNNENQTTISINNKGNDKLSSIRIESTSQENDEVIQRAIDSLYEKEKKETLFPNNFRGDIYSDWQFLLYEKDIVIELKTEHLNEDRLMLSKGNDFVMFNLRYTTAQKKRGFFISLTIKEKTNQSLVLILKDLLKNG
ncbi:hypothetical protein [Olleya namhaensis]|uniref:UvrD-like helicase C-terminal domain-containing protein n=1 Tax=Olleya namhaensis TaxID=1144750 RepID=A0A1I3MT15_9FLAO|nr:hypothetical protein [Olleya namhaensis]SFI99875.1 hypothetical protein SAMN05443431_103283 [Olleya namhaensis]